MITSQDKNLEDVYDYLSSINKSAYNNKYLIFNDILSKNVFSTDYVSNVLESKPIKKINPAQVFLNFFIYYIKSIILILYYFIKKLIFNIYIDSYKLLDKRKTKLTLIDTFFNYKSFKNNNYFKDNYFYNLENYLRDKVLFFYIPILDQKINIIDFIKIVKESNVKDRKLILEQNFISLSDFPKIVFFVLKYPIEIFKFTKKITSKDLHEQHLKNELLKNIKYVNFHVYVRFLMGQKISDLQYSDLKIISWFENQVINKAFYMGLRKKNNNNLKVVGAMPYVHSKEELNTNIDENEIIFKIIPDVIVVNSINQIPKNTKLKYVIGPSLRYKDLMGKKIAFKERDKILVVLTIYDHEIRNILSHLNDIKESKNKIIIKFHPNTNSEKYVNLIPDGSLIVQENFLDIYTEIKIVIGISTGILIEASTLAIPSLIIPFPGKLSIKYFNKKGKGLIWDELLPNDDINHKIEKLILNSKNSKNELLDLASIYKKDNFNYPTESNIKQAFINI